MMINELWLLAHVIFIGFMAGISLRLGKEALVAFTVIMIILANFFVLKQTMFFGLHATTADALAIGSMLGFNLIQEFYSRALARKTIAITFVFLAMYAFLSQFHLGYMPSAVDTSHTAFTLLLGMVPWLVGGSIIIWALSQGIDFVIFGLLQRLWQKNYLLIRNYIAIGASQILDTFLFTQLLYWLGIITAPLHVFIISFTIKMAIILITTPIVTVMAARYKP